MVRISSFQATLVAWKSIEWPSLPVVDQGDREDVADLAAQRSGPGTWPLKVHISCVTPGRDLHAPPRWRRSVDLVHRAAGRRGAAPGRAACQVGGGLRAPGRSSPGGRRRFPPRRRSVVAAVARPPPTLMSITMPASLWPGTVHHAWSARRTGRARPSRRAGLEHRVPVAPVDLQVVRHRARVGDVQRDSCRRARRSTPAERGRRARSRTRSRRRRHRHRSHWTRRRRRAPPR